MKLLLFISIVIIIFIQSLVFADEPIQLIKGRIINLKTQQPIPGVTIMLVNTKYGSISRKDGTYRIPDVKVGRYIIKFSIIGYEPIQYEIVISSGKEEILNAQMQESYVKINEVNIVAERNSFVPINESSIISSTIFTVDEVERYAGSRMDPARMAQNYAGVVSANDNRNDIIIRGGSPTELLWRIDGLDVPNPNHFATQGSTGGPVSALNSNVLDNSDFLIGAWSSEYGDKMSGVFDLRTRKGNDEKYEFLGQFGVNGFELGAEGPLPGKQNSFIANYRYSFLDLMEKMGIDFGFSGIPRYQDGILKMDIHASDNHQISTTAMFGVGSINMTPADSEDVADDSFDTNSESDFYIIALNWQHLYSDRCYGKLTLGTVNSFYINDEDSVYIKNNELYNIPYFRSKSSEGYYSAKYVINYSANAQHFFNMGIEERYRFYDLYAVDVNPDDNEPEKIDNDGTSNQILSFLNWQWRVSETITTDIGLFSQYLGISDKSSIEPRFALSWKFLPLHCFSLGIGIYRQSLPLVTYYSHENNQGLDFMQSVHYVAGYSYQITENSIVKIEGYYKDLSHIPVDNDELNYWSFINAGANFGVVSGMGVHAVSAGTGRTYGLELSYFKNFSKNYYFTTTGSYIRQEYKGSDGIMRFGAFDNIFVANCLGGYEWVINPLLSFQFSGKYTIAGGNPYIPIDLEKSIAANDKEYDKINAYSERKPYYSRFDLRIDIRYNFLKSSIISYFSLENLFNTKNVDKYKYNRTDKTIEPSYQLGLFFIGGIKIEF